MPEIVDISRRPAHLGLKPGDPWGFIMDQPLVALGEPVQVGQIIGREFEEGGETYLFEITEISHESAYEARFVSLLKDQPGPISYSTFTHDVTKMAPYRKDDA